MNGLGGFQLWFELAFLWLMIGTQGPMLYVYRRRILKDAAPDIRARILSASRPNRIRFNAIWLTSFIALNVWWLAQAFGVPHVSGPYLFWVTFLVFHAIWWIFAAPVLYTLQARCEAEGLIASARPGRIRTASLKLRRAEQYLPRYATPLLAAIGISCTAYIAIQLILFPMAEPILWWLTLSFAGAGLLNLGLCHVCSRFTATHGRLSAGMLEQDGEAFRNLMTRAAYWLVLAMSVAMFGIAAACVEVARGTLGVSAPGIAGAIAGSLLGAAGGAVGIMSALHAHKLRTAAARSHGAGEHSPSS